MGYRWGLCGRTAKQTMIDRKHPVNPYRPSAVGVRRRNDYELQCPHCSHRFALTWERYWKHGFGHHCCPHCGGGGQLRCTADYVVKISLCCLVCYGGALLPVFFFTGAFMWSALAALLIAASCIVTLFDRYLDARRPLVAKYETPSTRTS